MFAEKKKNIKRVKQIIPGFEDRVDVFDREAVRYAIKSVISVIMNLHGDDRLRRGRLVPDCEPRGTDLVKSVQKTSVKNTSYAALPLAA
jgi:hypothetical protein